MSGQLYSLVRDLPAPSNVYQWDSDKTLTATVALSCLIHPTSAGLVYAARLKFNGSDKLDEIYPAVISGISSQVFLSPMGNVTGSSMPTHMCCAN
jgi:zinc transporter ZupT